MHSAPQSQGGGFAAGATSGEQPVRAVIVVLAASILAGGCSDDKPVAQANQVSSEEILKRDCADQNWRDKNLGLWYSVCRPPLRW
jgi:hypothetical protein